MRRGCISLGNIKCDACGRDINYPERYLIVDEKDGEEVASNDDQIRYCVDCALAKGYAHYRQDKNDRVLTFLP
jgi:ribosomal protein S26